MSSFKFKNLNAVLMLFAVAIIGFGNIVLCNFLYYDKQKYSGTTCTTADKRWGECNSNCMTLTKEQQLTKENTCGFEKGEILFCCPKHLINSSVIYPTLTATCLNADEPSNRRQNASGYGYEKKQAELSKISSLALSVLGSLEERLYGFLDELREETLSSIIGENFLIYNQHCEFGHQPSGDLLVGGGQVAYYREFPFMAALGWKNYDNTTSWSCGGTLIHPSFVLTAAHCNDGGPPDIVRMGAIDLNNARDRFAEVDYDVVQLFMHNEYNSAIHYNDIALLKVKVKEEDRYKGIYSPSCIWMHREIPVTKLNLLGYGAADFGRSYTEKLLKADLGIVPNAECAKYYGKTGQLPQGIIDSQLCAFDSEGKKDSCPGDSGGPLQFNSDKRYLVGIISFGKQCLDGTPGVYTRIFYFLEWIEKTLRENF